MQEEWYCGVMEFSYQVSENDYVRASKLAMKLNGSSKGKAFFFWCFIVICLLLLFSVVRKNTHPSEETNKGQSVAAEHAPAGEALMVNLAPAVAVLGVWGLIFFYWIPNAARRLYRKDSNSRGTITVSLDTESFALRSTAGLSMQSSWNVFIGWYEEKNIVLLRYPNGTSQFLHVAGLSEGEREELRGILTVALPKKK